MASAPKTTPTDADVDEFLAAAEPRRRREDGQELDRIFREVTGTAPVMWGPSIVGYGSYAYVSPANPRTRGTWPKAGFSPRRTALSLYGLKDLPAGAALLPRLGTYTEGAGCVYVKKLSDVDTDVLRELIAIAWGRGDDTVVDGSAASGTAGGADTGAGTGTKTGGSTGSGTKTGHRIFATTVASVYHHYVVKVERKGRTVVELDDAIRWLTGFTADELRTHLDEGTTFADFFAAAQLNPHAELITGVVCGVRVEEVEDPLMRKIRYLDKLVDEIARGKAMEKVLRRPSRTA